MCLQKKTLLMGAPHFHPGQVWGFKTADVGVELLMAIVHADAQSALRSNPQWYCMSSGACRCCIC